MTADVKPAWKRWTEVRWRAEGRDVLIIEPLHGAYHGPPPRTVVARSMVHADGLNEYIVQLHNAALATATESLDVEELHPAAPWNNTSD